MYLNKQTKIFVFLFIRINCGFKRICPRVYARCMYSIVNKTLAGATFSSGVWTRRKLQPHSRCTLQTSERARERKVTSDSPRRIYFFYIARLFGWAGRGGGIIEIFSSRGFERAKEREKANFSLQDLVLYSKTLLLARFTPALFKNFYSAIFKVVVVSRKWPILSLVLLFVWFSKKYI